MGIFEHLMETGCAGLLADYINSASRLVLVLLYDDRTIADCNRGFMRIAGIADKPRNLPIDMFLEDNSDKTIPMPESGTATRVRLSLVSQDMNLSLLEFSVFKAGPGAWLLVGENMTLNNNEIVTNIATLYEKLNNQMRELHKKNIELEKARREIKILSGLLPICSYCKNIRDDTGYWNKLEQFIQTHSDADFTHSICPECFEKHFSHLMDKKDKNE